MTSEAKRVLPAGKSSPALRGSGQVLWHWLLISSPVLLAVLLMLPRLLSAQFGLFDDGVTIMNAQRITGGLWSAGWEAETGRYRPAYWLYYALIYLVAGASPLAFFLGNLLLLAGTTILLMAVVRAAGGSKLHSLISGVLFVLAGPVIENYYTLSKGEPLQLFWVLAALRLGQVAGQMPVLWKKAALWTGASTALLLANASKETSLVMIPVAFAWAALAWLWNRRTVAHPQVKGRLKLCIAALVAGLVFFTLRRMVVPVGLTEGGYTSLYELGLGGILASAFRWTGWLIRDLPYLFPLGVFAVAAGVIRKKVPHSLFIVETLTWMAAWMVIFLPWHFTVEYYMLPLMAGSAALAGLLVDWAVGQFNTQSRSLRALAGVCLGIAGLALMVSVTNNISNARLQLAVDAANADMLTYLTENVPTGGKVYVNLPAYNEYVYEVELHLAHLRGRADIQVDRYQFNRPEPGVFESLSYWVVSPEIENQPLLSVRMGVYEQGVQDWNASLRRFLGSDQDPVYVAERRFQLSSVDFLRLGCPLFSGRNYCSPPYLIFDDRPLTYKWNIYWVELSVLDQALPGMFKDGVWSLLLPNGDLKTIHFGRTGDLPLTGDWNGDGQTGLAVFRPADLTWHFDTNLDGIADIDLRLDGMQAGDLPFVGDWNGDGINTPGFFRPSEPAWYFRSSLTDGLPDLPPMRAGAAGDLPLAGDWNGDGRSGIGVYRPESGEVNLENRLDVQQLDNVDFLLPPQSQPTVGDWNGRGFASLAAVVDGTWMPQVANCDCKPSNSPRPFYFDIRDGIPVAGYWR